MLELKASIGLPDSFNDKCREVPFGHCLCGRAAESGEVLFTERVDERHVNRYKGMEHHGEYCVPFQ